MSRSSQAPRSLILHIGPPKTGTTTLQSALEASRAALALEGILLPLAEGSSPAQHTPILREVIGDDAFETHCAWSQDTLSLQATLDQWHRSGAPSLLLSSENLVNSSHDWLGKLLDSVAADKCVVVMGVRSPLHWCRSWHSQDVKAGLGEESTVTADEYVRHFVSHRLQPFSDAIRREKSRGTVSRLHVVAVPESPDGSLETAFSAAIGVTGLFGQQTPLNQAHDLCYISTVQAANVILDEPRLSLAARAHRQHWVRDAMDDMWMSRPWHSGADCGVAVDSHLAERMAAEATSWFAEISDLVDASWGDVRSVMSTLPHGLPFVRFPETDDFQRANEAIARAFTSMTLYSLGLRDARDYWRSIATRPAVTDSV